ncbi:MAG TPA: hypothetical protein VKB96_02870 [Gammaproteobacteria bacterium]|nr:hypothetical protein [Gammaproteobacteria bacterium]
MHRIDRKRSAVIPWTPLKELFGWQYSLMIDFKRVFEVSLGQVHACVYPDARFHIHMDGLTLFFSRPPAK